MWEVEPAVVAGLFAPERPGPLVHAHVAATGVGSDRADRTTRPRSGLAVLPGGNVVTGPGARGRVLPTACAAAFAADVRRRGKQPSWTTSPDNAASRAVAGRLGFVLEREDVLHAVGTFVPGVGCTRMGTCPSR